MFKNSRRINDNRSVFEDIQKALRHSHVHDLSLHVGSRTFTADRYVLFARSPYWRNVLQQADIRSFTIEQLRSESVQKLLQYIYFGRVTILKEAENIFQILVAAHQFEMTRLFTELNDMILELVNMDNIFEVYVKSHKFEITELTDRCLSYLDSYSLDVYTKPQFSQLPLEPLRTVLDRSTFFAPEHALLSLVVNYLSAHPEVPQPDLLSCIRFKLIEPEEINVIMAGHTWLTLDAIEQYTSDNSNKNRECRVKQTNLVTEHLKPVIVHASLSSSETNFKLQIDYDCATKRLKFPEDHSLNDLIGDYDRCEMVLKLEVPCQINLMLIFLKNKLRSKTQSGEFSFIVKGSPHGIVWITLVERIDDCGQGWQKLFFPMVTIRFIKIIGLDWSPGKNLHFFWSWVLYLKHSFKLENIRCYYDSYQYWTLGPFFKVDHNIATNHWGVVVYENCKKLSTSMVFDGHVKVSEKKQVVSVSSGQFIDIVLSQAFFVDSMRFLIVDTESATFGYKIYVWHNHEEIWYDLQEQDFNGKHPPTSEKWKCIQTTKGAKGWQTVEFPLEKVAVVSIQCTEILSGTMDTKFGILHFELPKQEHE